MSPTTPPFGVIYHLLARVDISLCAKFDSSSFSHFKYLWLGPPSEHFNCDQKMQKLETETVDAYCFFSCSVSIKCPREVVIFH